MAALPKPSKLMMDGFIKVQGRQTTGALLTVEDNGQYAACALGCIGLGLGLDPENLKNKIDLPSGLTKQLFDDWTLYPPTQMGLSTQNRHPIGYLIITLNDTINWTIPQISNWLYEQGL